MNVVQLVLIGVLIGVATTSWFTMTVGTIALLVAGIAAALVLFNGAK
jgi:hypothetical protein